jgi:hypothetical protein
MNMDITACCVMLCNSVAHTNIPAEYAVSAFRVVFYPDGRDGWYMSKTHPEDTLGFRCGCIIYTLDTKKRTKIC